MRGEAELNHDAKMNKQHLTSRLPGNPRDTTSALFPRARLTALTVSRRLRPAAAWSDALHVYDPR